jgi:hypothetical protein
MPNPADEEELKRTLISARLLCAGLAAAAFACLLVIWHKGPHGFFIYLANWLLLSPTDPPTEITRTSLHLTVWAMIIAAVGLFFFLLSLNLVGSLIFAGAGIVSLFHFNDRNMRFAAIGRALAAPIMDLISQNRS